MTGTAEPEPPRSRVRRFVKTLAVLLVLGVAAAGGWLFHSGQLPKLDEARATQPPEPAKPISVTVTPARIADVSDQLLVSGTLVARHEILVGPEIDGLRVVDILAEEGDSVAKDSVLARLDRSNLDIVLAQNTSSLAKAEASIAQASATVAEAEATEVDALGAFERVKSLQKSGNATLETAMAREAAARVAQARVNAARQALHVAEADRTLVQALRRELELRLGRAEIKAPESGIISRRMIRLGAVVSSSGDPLFRIVQDGVIELAAEVPETALPGIRPGQTAPVLPAGLKQPIAGTVRLVSGAVDASSRLGTVWITLPPDPALRPGQFGRGTIVLARRRGIAVPQSAVLFGDEGAYVQVVDAKGIVESRAVTTGIKSEGIVELTDGLKDGETVVTRAGGFLRSGDRVTPILAGAGA